MSVAETFLSIMSTVGTVLLWTWWLILIGLLFGLKKKWSKYPIEAIIIEKRGDNLIKTNDRTGKFEDKSTNMHGYVLQSTKEKIPVYNYDWIMHANMKPTTVLDRIVNFIRPTIGTVFLFKYGSGQFKPINISDKKDSKMKLVKVKDKDGSPIYKYDYAQFDPRWVLGVLDFEVVDWDNMNFMVQEQRATAVRRAKKGEFWAKTLIPLAIIGAAVVISIIMMKFSSDAGASLRGGVPLSKQTETSGKVMGGIQNVITPGT